jgi:hypothetical protein
MGYIELILIALVVLALVYYYVNKKTGLTFSDEEKKIVAKLYEEESKLLAEFTKGKEEVLLEYERLKARLQSLISLRQKIPVNNEVIVSSAVEAAKADMVNVAPVIVTAPLNPVVDVIKAPVIVNVEAQQEQIAQPQQQAIQPATPDNANVIQAAVTPSNG